MYDLGNSALSGKPQRCRENLQNSRERNQSSGIEPCTRELWGTETLMGNLNIYAAASSVAATQLKVLGSILSLGLLSVWKFTLRWNAHTSCWGEFFSLASATRTGSDLDKALTDQEWIYFYALICMCKSSFAVELHSIEIVFCDLNLCARFHLYNIIISGVLFWQNFAFGSSKSDSNFAKDFNCLHLTSIKLNLKPSVWNQTMEYIFNLM